MKFSVQITDANSPHYNMKGILINVVNSTTVAIEIEHKIVMFHPSQFEIINNNNNKKLLFD